MTELGHPSTRAMQQEALARKLYFGLLRPFSGMDPSVRLGEITQTILSSWSVKPLPPKAVTEFCYLTIVGRPQWLMLRESLLSLYHTWKALPRITVVSDGSWTEHEFKPVFGWWPGTINVLHPEEIRVLASAADEVELRQYAEVHPYGLKLASIILLARQKPVLYVDSDILWFSDPTAVIGPPSGWTKPMGIREGSCCQAQELAMRHCPQVLAPPYVNSGMIALHGELLSSELLRPMVRYAITDPRVYCEQTIVAAGVKLGRGFFPEKLCLVEFDDVAGLRQRSMSKEGYHSRHYVNWMRHLLYRDAFRLRFKYL
jgi:hypothetical protein